MKVARVNDRPFQTLDSLLGIGASIPPIVFPDSPSTILQLINKSGGDVDAGDVVVIDPGDDVSFTTTTNAREEISVGIAQDTIVADASGPILVEGYATLVNVQASVTRGDFLETYTVAKQADGNATRHSGSFGQFLTGGTTPLAWLWGSTDPSASGTITVGDGGTPVTGVDTVIFSGASVTDDTGGQVTVTVGGGSGGVPGNALQLAENGGSGTSIACTFGTTPLSTSKFFALFSEVVPTSAVTSITQTNVTWTQMHRVTNTNGASEIWKGVPSGGTPGTTVTAAIGTSIATEMTVSEWPVAAGLSATIDLSFDRTGSSAQQITTYPAGVAAAALVFVIMTNTNGALNLTVVGPYAPHQVNAHNFWFHGYKWASTGTSQCVVATQTSAPWNNCIVSVT